MPGSSRQSAAALVGGRYQLIRELRADHDTVEWEGFDAALGRPVTVQLLRTELAQEPAAVARFWQAARAAARETDAAGERVLDAGTDPESARLFVVREWLASTVPTTDAAAVVSSTRAHRPSHPRGLRRWLVAGSGLVLLLLAAVAIRPSVDGWLAWVNAPLARSDQVLSLARSTAVPASGGQRPAESRPTPAAAPPTVVAAAPTQPAPTPVRSATATVVRAGQTRRIVNTDGRGVALRATAGGDRLPAKGYDEGATVQAFEQSGEWTRIRGSDGREGWVLSVTLAP